MRRLSMVSALALLVAVAPGCVSGRSTFSQIATNYRRVLADHERYIDADSTLDEESKKIRKDHARSILDLAVEGAR